MCVCETEKERVHVCVCVLMIVRRSIKHFLHLLFPSETHTQRVVKMDTVRTGGQMGECSLNLY